MGKTSSTVKYRYNSKTYKQFNVQIKPDLFEQIDNYCKQNNLSRSAFLKLSIETLTNNNQ